MIINGGRLASWITIIVMGFAFWFLMFYWLLS